MSAVKVVGIAIACMLLAMPNGASAQTGLSGSIAGVVRDTTGAVLPGVTVEATSPALIDKVRTVVTDEQGQYKIIDLRPGTYTVTFTLTGFGSVRREGLEINTGVTAPANAELKVGALEETVLVTGASPVVDVQNVRGQNVLTREKLDEIPTAKTFQSFAAVTVGATGGREVGGNKGETNGGLSIHGAGSGLTTVDGMRVTVTHQNGTPRIYMFNNLAAQEIVLETAAVSAEGENGSLNVNLVPRDGSNEFNGLVVADYTNLDLQSSNFDDALRARGLLTAPATRKIWDAGFGLGGPIVRDKLWFFTAHRTWGGTAEYAGNYFNKSPNPLFYEPDLDRPAYQTNKVRDNTLRMRWQTGQSRFTAMHSMQRLCKCYYFTERNFAPEASNILYFDPNDQTQITWTLPATNRLLLEAGVAHRNERQLTGRPPETPANARAVIEASTGMQYGAQFRGPNLAQWLDDQDDHRNAPNWSSRASASYITGSHAFKFGVTTYSGKKPLGGNPTQPEMYTFRNRIPQSITMVASPNRGESRIALNMGLYAQDQWTLGRMTLNLGGRFDYMHAYNPEQTRPAGKYTPELHFNKIDNVPLWKDFSPRLGVAYDLFGTGRTASKASVGRYVGAEAMGVSFQFQPGLLLQAITTRNWNDSTFGAGDPRSGNYVPDCDLRSPVANGECGAMAQSNFGSTVPGQVWDPELLTGLRPYNWQTSAGIQHELREGFGISFSYHRTTQGNLRVTDNRAVTPSDYDTYCVTAPTDPRLGAVSGQRLCGLADIKPTAFGRSDPINMPASKIAPDRSQTYNGFDINLNSRFGRGGMLQGGVSTGQTVTDNCDVIDSPATLYCETVSPFVGSLQIKLSGVYPMPGGFQVSAVLQNLPGAAISASRIFTNAEVAGALGRNLGSCGAAATCTGTVSIQMIQPGTMREKRDSQVDFRVSRNLRIGRYRIQPRLDVYNLFNSNSILVRNNTYGAVWGTPTDVLAARMFKIGGQVTF